MINSGSTVLTEKSRSFHIRHSPVIWRQRKQNQGSGPIASEFCVGHPALPDQTPRPDPSIPRAVAGPDSASGGMLQRIRGSPDRGKESTDHVTDGQRGTMRWVRMLTYAEYHRHFSGGSGSFQTDKDMIRARFSHVKHSAVLPVYFRDAPLRAAPPIARRHRRRRVGGGSIDPPANARQAVGPSAFRMLCV